jgi:undecaprenyl diphosphate synthase
MTQSTIDSSLRSRGLHVGIIMDGNGRWATARGLPRLAGHRTGAESVRAVVEASPDLGIRALTLYAFSADNWRRPTREIAGLMRLFRSYLRSETPRLIENGIRLRFLGRRDRLALPLQTAMADAERATSAGRTLTLRLAIDYAARDAIVRAAELIRTSTEDTPVTRDRFAAALAASDADPEHSHSHAERAPDVDLLIRTGGEKRLSDFLLWECAYAELYFTECMWPEFRGAELAAAIDDFRSRERRFGGLTAKAAV